MRYIKNNENSLSRGSDEQLNAEKIFPRYSDVVLPDGESINPHAKDSAFSIMCEFTEKYTKLTKWSCLLNCCTECPGVFVPDVEMNAEDYAYLTLI